MNWKPNLRWAVVLAGAALVLGTWALQDVPIVEHWLVRIGLLEKAPEPWQFEMIVDLEFDGEPVHLEKVIQCQPVRRKNPAGRRYRGWTESQYAISKALPDGSGLMAIVPRYCYDNIEPAGPYSPLILWVDDVRAPKLIEAYFGNVADHDKPGSRLKIKRVSTQVPTDKSPSPRAADEFADKVPLGRRLPLTDKRQGYFALAGYIVPRALWQENPKIAKTVPVGAAIAQVERESGWRFLMGNLLSDSVSIDDGWYPTANRPNRDLEIDSLSSGTKAIPLRKVGSAWVMIPEQMGTLVYYNKVDLPESEVFGPQPITYEIFGHRIEAANSYGAAFLFSDRDDLVAIVSTVISITLLSDAK